MSDRTIIAPLARWSSRIALFAVSLLLVGVAMHRLTSFPTPVALNLFAVAGIGAVLAILVGLVSLAQIWRTGYGGAGNAALGIVLSVVAFAGPLFYLPAYLNLPHINDVTTDLSAPPRFAALAKQRAATSRNPVAYPGPRFAELQAKAYPELRTLVMDRSVDEAFELVEDTVRRLRWRVAVTDAPTIRPPKAGTLEATDQTLIVGFTDDIVVRVEGNVNRARIDVRSASRFGSFDFGQNAARVRRFMAELQTRIDGTGATTAAGRRALRASRAAMIKRAKERDQKKAADRTAKGRAQSSARRAREQKETLR